MSTDHQAAEPAVLLERVDEHIALVTLNRPQARNAVNAEVASAFSAIVDEIEADESYRAVVLAARGPMFCAGLDLKVVTAGDPYVVVHPEKGFAGFVYARRSKPWIAAIHGVAFGGGTEIALACDMIVAGPDAFFGLPEVKRGLIAGAAGAYRVTRVLPRPLAIEMVVTGAPISASRAYETGFVNRLVAKGEEVAEALALARAIAQNAPLSVRESLRLVRFAADVNEAAIRDFQEEVIATVLASGNAAEGANAFLEKRPPQWRD
jgi:enoyl-CoA hydratase